VFYVEEKIIIFIYRPIDEANNIKNDQQDATV
jgi:hypothetical protein